MKNIIINLWILKEIKFYHKYMIFHLSNNDSHLFMYDDIEEFHLTYMHGG